MSPTERLSRRVSAIAPSATLAVDAKAKALRAAGEPVIGFGAGEPDFPTPEHIVAAAAAACREPANHHYSPTPGLPRLREAVAAKTARDSGFEVDSSAVVITNGGKQAYYETIRALVDEGDEVLLPAPYWTTYPEPIALSGGRSVVLPTDESSGFRVTVDELEDARTEDTKALVFVSPSNPSGAVYSPDEVQAIGEWALETGVWVITDEIYEHLVYGDNEFASMPTLVPGLADQCAVLNGVAKSYAMTGWRVGWVIGPPDLIRVVSTLQSHLSSNVANISQQAAIAALEGDLTAVAEMRAEFDERRQIIHAMLNEIDGVSCREPEGAFYAFPSFEGLLQREIAGRVPTSTLELADLVLDEAKVAFVPGEAFGAPGYARFSYALDRDDMVEGITRLGDFLATATATG